jgi:hypothetical protein
MIGALAILLVAFWYYNTAEKASLPALQWIIGGVVVYYAGFLGWMYLLLKPMLGGQFKEHSFLLGITMDVSAVLAGIALSALFRQRVMLKKAKKPFESMF